MEELQYQISMNGMNAEECFNKFGEEYAGNFHRGDATQESYRFDNTFVDITRKGEATISSEEKKNIENLISRIERKGFKLEEKK